MIDITQPKYRGHGRDVVEFLLESNAIEGVYDEDSLDQALYAWKYITSMDKLTTGVVLKTHKILMLHQRLMPDEKGYFRTVPVWVGATYGADWKEIPDLIEEWCNDAMNSVKVPGKDNLNIRIDHVQYEKIHPFVDGNGRTGRIFMNWQLIKAGEQPVVILNSQKQDYYKWFTEGVK